MDHERPYAEEIRGIAEHSREALGELRTALSEAVGARRERLSDLSDRATAVVTELASQIAKELAGDLAEQYQRRTDDEREELDEERASLNADREAIESDRDAVRAEREALDSERQATRREREALESERDQLAARRTQLDEQQSELETQREAATPEFEALQSEQEALRQRQGEIDEQRDAIAAEREQADAAREAVANERAEWESVRSEVEADLARREESLIADAELLRNELAEARNGSSELIAARDDALDEAAAATEHAQQLSEALEEANRRLTFAAESHGEHVDLKEKFDLAIADLQTHRERVAELEQELTQRPEDNGESAAEIERLQAERDDLARRLEEAATAAPPEGDSAEIEDLRTRFEMAVDDIRQLKTENNELREQLSEAESAVTGGGGGAGNDWEAQKQRLLASLESEGEPADPDRQEERASIAGTIQITDEALAEKDREIDQLKTQLESRPEAPAGDDAAAEATAALLDEDELIRTERERLAKLEQEWQEKLRTAELELSVERAKISRAQSELAEQQVELETLRASQSGDPSAGRNRWMDKLGLGGDSK